MPSIKAIKQRRASVKNMQQAMRAMNLVATAKLQRARQERDNALPFVRETDALMLTAAQDAPEHFFVQGRGPSKKALYLVITSDRGKCGGYNINMSKAVINHARDHDKSPAYYIVGMRGLEYFLTRNEHVLQYVNAPAGTPGYEQAKAIASELLRLFGNDTLELAGEYDEVYVAYTKFVSILAQEPTITQVFPLSGRLAEQSKSAATPSGYNTDMLFDPGTDKFIDYMANMYLTTFIYGAMMESVVCEQASRMLNMDAATNNAEEIIQDLTLLFNRQRQSVITQEITEIVSGANALA